MCGTKLASSGDAYFVDFGAERKKCESKVSSAQFWGEKVMVTWAQLEYNHGIAMKKWAETQKCHLRFAEDGCPEVLRDSLKTLIESAERKAATLMRFSHQIEEYRGVRNILVSFETRDFKPTIERLSKEMRSLVTSHKIREAQAKREKKKHRENMKKFQEKEKPLAEGHHEDDEADLLNGRVAECQSQAATTTLDRYNSTTRIEKSQRQDFVKLASKLQEDWAGKQTERLCLLLTCIQSFAKKIKLSDLERTKDTPIKKIKDMIKKTDVGAIVRELQEQYSKIYVSPEESEANDELEDGIPRSLSFSKPMQDPGGPSHGHIPPTTMVTLPNVSDTYRMSNNLPPPAVYRKLDNSCKLMPPSFHFQPRTDQDKQPESHTYANCHGNKKLLSTSPMQRQLLTPTTVDITALRHPPCDASHLTPMESALLMGDGKSSLLEEEMVEKRLKATLVPKSRANCLEASAPTERTNSSRSDPLAVGKQAKRSTLKAITTGGQDGLTARPSTPVANDAPRKHRKGCLGKAQTIDKPTPASAPATPAPVQSPYLDVSSLKARQASKVFLKVIATSRKSTVDEIVRKHYGRHRKLTPSPQSGLPSQTLVLLRKSPDGGE